MRHFGKAVKATAFVVGSNSKAGIKPNTHQNLHSFTRVAKQDLVQQRHSVKLFDSEAPPQGFNFPEDIMLPDETGLPKGATSPERIDSVLKDIVALSSVPEGALKSLKPLEKKGVFVKEYEGSQNYGLKTPDGSYFELRTLAKIDKDGFRARAIAVHEVNESGEIQRNPSSVRVAFGGTAKWSDAPRTVAMHLTKMPISFGKNIDKLLNETSSAYKEAYGKDISSQKLVVSAHSAGTTHAMEAYKKLNLQYGIKSKLRLYEPFGANYHFNVNKDSMDHSETISYQTHNSFLASMGYDGATIGYTEVLPKSKEKDACNGAGILGSIEGHKLVCVASQAIDKERNKGLLSQVGVFDIMHNSTNVTNTSSRGRALN